MNQLYKYNPETLQPEPVNMKKLVFWIYFPLFLGLLFNFIYFRAPLIEDWQWKAEPNEPLKKETVKLTIDQWAQQK